MTWMDPASTLLVIAAGAVAATLLLELFARSPTFVAALVLGVSAIGTVVDPELVPPISIGAFSVFVTDVLFALVAGAALVRLVGMRTLPLGTMGLLVLSALVLWSLARGATADLEAAVTEFRLPFAFVAGAAYFATVSPDPRQLRWLNRMFLGAAGLILVATGIHWVALWAGAPPPFMAPPYETNFRVVHADRALLLAQAFVLALGLRQDRETANRLRLISGLLLVAVFALQHRTVWIALAAGVVVAMARSRGMRTRIAVPLVLAGALGLLFVIGTSGGSSPSLAESLGTQSTNADTFRWRVEGWQALLEGGSGSVTDALVGTPFGEGFRRTVAGEIITVSPHNHLLSTYLRSGLIGLAALLWAYGYGIVRLAHAPPSEGGAGFGDPDTMLVLLVTQLVFFLAYAPGIEQGLVLGLGLSLASVGSLTRPLGGRSSASTGRRDGGRRRPVMAR